MSRTWQVFVASGLLALCAGTAWADGARMPEELAAQTLRAIVTKDAKAISALYNWEGVAPDIADLLKQNIETMLEEKPRKSEVRPLPGDFEAVQEMGGKRFQQNLKVDGVVALVYSPDDDSAIATMPFGRKNGLYYFTAPVVVQMQHLNE